MINLPSLESAHVKGKRVFVRCDFDVPLSQQSTINNQQLTIADDTRLVSGVSTIEYLMDQGALVIAAGHLGRPKRQLTIDNLQLTNDGRNLSLEPIAKWFAEEFPGTSVKQTHIGGFTAWKLKENFYILENLRFGSGEEENDSAFSHKLAYLADVYINEAFGSSHRAHASIVGVPKLLPHFAGFHFQKEIKILSDILDNPKKPLTFIVGGAKIETKLPLISKMHKLADYVLVGGELAEQDKVLIREQHENTPAQKAFLLIADLNSEKTDITKISLENFLQIIIKSSFKLALADLKPGQKISAFGPIGYFDFDPKNKTQNIFLAGGMGITPFHSILRYIDANQIKSKIILIASFQNRQEAVFYNEIKGIEKKNSAIKIIYSLTNEKILSSDFEKGRIDENMIKKYAQNYSASNFFIVGPPAMVESMFEIVVKLGISEEKIFKEDFSGY